MIIIGLPNYEHALKEMAYPSDKVEQKLTASENIVFEHLLKLFYFRNFPDYFNGWTASVAQMRMVHKIKKGKGKDHLPDAQTIYDWVWGDRADCFKEHHRGIIKDFNYKSNPDYASLPYIHAEGDADTAAKFMDAYYIWLAKELSNNGIVSLSDIQDKIKELFKRYPYRNK